MLLHENTLISLDILEEEFVCNLSACKGACCIEGEYGAPLEPSEIEVMVAEMPVILSYLKPLSVEIIAESGFYEKDPDGDLVTQCISGRECVFAVREKGIYKCGIEKAFIAGKTDFHKPVSCHLYPIRISTVGDYTALNYSRWDICSPACKNGKALKVPLYKFLKEPLIRRFGFEWYSGLELIADEYLKTRRIK